MSASRCRKLQSAHYRLESACLSRRVQYILQCHTVHGYTTMKSTMQSPKRICCLEFRLHAVSAMIRSSSAELRAIKLATLYMFESKTSRVLEANVDQKSCFDEVRRGAGAQVRRHSSAATASDATHENMRSVLCDIGEPMCTWQSGKSTRARQPRRGCAIKDT